MISYGFSCTHHARRLHLKRLQYQFLPNELPEPALLSILGRDEPAAATMGRADDLPKEPDLPPPVPAILVGPPRALGAMSRFLSGGAGARISTSAPVLGPPLPGDFSPSAELLLARLSLGGGGGKLAAAAAAALREKELLAAAFSSASFCSNMPAAALTEPERLRLISATSVAVRAVLSHAVLSAAVFAGAGAGASSAQHAGGAHSEERCIVRVDAARAPMVSYQGGSTCFRVEQQGIGAKMSFIASIIALKGSIAPPVGASEMIGLANLVSRCREHPNLHDVTDQPNESHKHASRVHSSRKMRAPSRALAPATDVSRVL